LTYSISFVPPKRRRFIKSSLTYHKDNQFKLCQPLYKIQWLERNFILHGVGEEDKKLIDYIFEINIAHIDIVYPELIGYKSLDIIKDDRYLDKYIKRFKVEYEEYCKINNITND
jgi:hypothetical protein